ncbi:rhodanese-like domain-containing protein [Vibrio breoganii]|uniref:Rhodanese-like domain-containing protein n=1 Tax=Vibrio breoganii TaxID=553239 RepID=A0ABX1U6V9_9VIBR|nr:rhodanese-like domain-containing protein [Vibrio breoganii]NMO73760.1 rhodanese-like domain-containing protein [Vibrio breoganii]NMR70198.1 rhodanese-like domain-containing protein [Vibrio breoganii]PMF68183.1 sulfurtransferase [Vibrio breoganii]PMG04090.1 sulfurtransferase [Vibrio breoganii]PMG96547.1 sulfurtransferase [Vibrio breoganii]
MIKRLMALALLIPSMTYATSAFATERAEQAWEWIDSGAVVIDVRTPQEFNGGHLDNAVNIPVADLSRADLSFVDRDDHIVVYCRSGNRSGNAKQILLTKGYKHVHNGGGLQMMLSVSQESPSE